jgi:hypothetical protein
LQCNFENLVKLSSNLNCRLAWPAVNWATGTLGLLQNGTFFNYRRKNAVTVLFTKFGYSEVALARLRTESVDQNAENLKAVNQTLS